MVDVTIISPVTSIKTVSPVGQQVANNQESITLLKALSQLSVVSGTIIGKDTNGNFLLKTSLGNLALQSNLPLTYNSDLVIRLDSGNATVNNARIVSINGEPLTENSQSLEGEGTRSQD
ncbi:MAG: hypothetical protein WCJ33_03970, partial [Pseudomonadota bacterium]